MNTIQMGDNIARLRKEKRITQEALADFLGVTKASVSKWETGQCLPDILLIPRLAAFFDVSVDTLMGYEPQLAPEQIRRLYIDFSADFAAKPFDEVIRGVREVVKRYYSCYPLLFQIAILYLNHFMLTGSAETASELLREAAGLCGRITANCRDSGICGDAIALKAVIDLQLGDPAAAIEALEPLTDPTRLSGQNDSLLIQAYSASGMTSKAVDFAQISIYLHLSALVGESVQYIALNVDDRDTCMKTIERAEAVAEAYGLTRLNPNLMAQLHYQAAVNHMSYGENEEAAKRLKLYAAAVCGLWDGGECMLRGDDYFTRLDRWIETLALGANPPRDSSFIRRSALAALGSPVFEPLRDAGEFKSIVSKLEKENERHG